MPPVFSIITVVRNDRDGFERTRQSLESQDISSDKWEWIVIDGASTDGTAEAVRALAPLLAAWRSEPDRGVYDAMNKGIALAQGDFLLFLNAGDTMAAPDTLRRVAETLDPHAALVYGDSFEILPDGQQALKPARSAKTAWRGMFTHHQAMFFARDAAQKGYDLRYPIGADYGLVLKILSTDKQVQALFMPICVFFPAGLSQKHARQGRKDQYRLRRDVLNFPFLLNALLYSYQFTTFSIRIILPSIFNKIRLSKPQK